MNPYERDCFKDKMRPGGLELTEEMLKASKLSPCYILDAGCGIGDDSFYLKQKGFDVTGLDISSILIEKAKRDYEDIEFIVGDIEHMPFLSNSFDAVLCQCVLTVLSDLNLGMREINRILKPGGLLLFSDICLINEDDVKGIYTLKDLEETFMNHSFIIEESHFVHKEWKNFISKLIWNSKNLCELKDCLNGNANFKNITYCWGIIKKGE